MHLKREAIGWNREEIKTWVSSNQTMIVLKQKHDCLQAKAWLSSNQSMIVLKQKQYCPQIKAWLSSNQIMIVLKPKHDCPQTKPWFSSNQTMSRHSCFDWGQSCFVLRILMVWFEENHGLVWGKSWFGLRTIKFWFEDNHDLVWGQSCFDWYRCHNTSLIKYSCRISVLYMTSVVINSSNTVS
jgi:hypothetical protein